MGYTKIAQERLAAGMCIQCGAERNAPGSTKYRCAVCAERGRYLRRCSREQNHEKRENENQEKRRQTAARTTARINAGLCVRCNKKRTGGRRATAQTCAACAQNSRARNALSRQKKRNQAAGYTEGDGRNAAPKPMGAASTAKRDGGEYLFILVLDRASLEAILLIKQRYRDAETRAGRLWQTHQTSRLVRQVILNYEPLRVTVKSRKHRLLLETKANLSLDGRTKAILERQAALSFDGNKSAALRAMLIECQGFRRAVTARLYRR